MGWGGGGFLVNLIMNQPKSSQATPLSPWAINENKNQQKVNFLLSHWPNKEKLSAHNSVADDAASGLVKRGLRLRMA